MPDRFVVFNKIVNLHRPKAIHNGSSSCIRKIKDIVLVV